MTPLLVLTAPDGSSLVLSDEPDGLTFEHPGHGGPEPVDDRLAVLWPVIDRRQHVVLAGDTRAGAFAHADLVRVRFPHAAETYPVRGGVWMSFPAPYGEHGLDRGATITVTWLAGERVLGEQRTAPLASPWTGYAPTTD